MSLRTNRFAFVGFLCVAIPSMTAFGTGCGGSDVTGEELEQGTGGEAGSAGSAGTAGSSAAGTGGTSNAGSGGSAGTAGSAGAAGAAGAAGSAGSAGTAGTSGNPVDLGCGSGTAPASLAAGPMAFKFGAANVNLSGGTIPAGTVFVANALDLYLPNIAKLIADKGSGTVKAFLAFDAGNVYRLHFEATFKLNDNKNQTQAGDSNGTYAVTGNKIVFTPNPKCAAGGSGGGLDSQGDTTFQLEANGSGQVSTKIVVSGTDVTLHMKGAAAR